LASSPTDVYDYVIVGSGIAGLRAAMALAPAGRVLILTKADPAESNTGYAQGGIAAALGPGDSPEQHAQDTFKAGDGLCDAHAVRVLVEEGPRYVRELISWGANFDRDEHGELAFGLEAAHSVRRILHAGDATGRSIGRAMWAQVRPLGSVTTINHAFVTDLRVKDGRVAGVWFFDQSGARRLAAASAVLLATGGAGQVFSETTNPAVATGDGIALAFNAGARVADLEFVQFHPTALKKEGAPRFLISEALRGEGARLINVHGETFMQKYHPGGDLAPRDVVARGIVRESEATGGPVFLTLTHLDPERVRNRFPTIAAMCRQVGIDIATDRIPVGPAAHYLMGGVETDEWGRTSLPGLYAAGETACTGVHGANRLASNSLLEGLVFGARAGEAMQQPAAAAPLRADRGWKMSHDSPHPPVEVASSFTEASRLPLVRRSPGEGGSPEPRIPPPESLRETEAIRALMWRGAGLFRTRDGLSEAVDELDRSYAETREAMHRGAAHAEAWKRFNLLSVARLIARAALRREESRGGHFREDFPARDDLHWRVHLVDKIDEQSG
jgi:L-aspartate oxidase